jgi:S-DNA-T family DNA segregation ATPase FtsK/SpoIIIE
MPEGSFALVAPPREDPLQAGAAGWMQYLFPVVGSLGGMLFILNNPKPVFVASGVLFMVGSIGMGVGMGVQQRLTKRRRRTIGRERYLDYLHGVRAQLQSTAAAQRAASGWRHPLPGALLALPRSSPRMWERRPEDADFLQVRVGSGTRPLATALNMSREEGPPSQSDPVCIAALDELVRVHGSVSGQAIAVDLRDMPVVSILGARRDRLDVARALACQLVALHAPEEVRVLLCASPTAARDWEWMKWLPHLRPAGDDQQNNTDAKAVTDVGGLEEVLTTRAARARRQQDPTAPVDSGPWLVVLADGVIPPPDAVTLLRRSRSRTTLVALAESPAGEPSDVDLRVRVAGGTLDIERLGMQGARITGQADHVGQHSAEALARRLAPLRLSEEPGARRLAETISLTDLLGIKDVRSLDPALAWRPRSLADSLRVPIGVSADGDAVLLDLKESALGGDGPHGLVIGATGSGKSELLRTVVTGLALRHSPDLLAFVLADFKGGAAFAGLQDLPHVAGLITNLADDLAMVDRMHAALFGEIRRRQELLRAAGNLASLREYHSRRAEGADLPSLPYLVVLVDEFGELLASRPDFIDLFVAVGRLGRSLGMHLILCSQQLDEGRLRGLEGHLSYRIALRTFSAAESRSVLGVVDAYELPPIPGSAYLKVGTTVYTRFRAALVSQVHLPASESAAPPPRPRPFQLLGDEPAPTPSAGSETSPPGTTLIEVVVARLRDAAPKVHQVWLPTLEARVALDAVIGETQNTTDRGVTAVDWPSPGKLSVPLGLVDKPAEQARDVFVVDLAGSAGHLMVVGASLTGKTTLLRTMIASFVLTHTPLEVQFYCIDYGGGGLAPLAGLPHVGGVAGRQDPERVRRTVAEVVALLDERETRFTAAGIDSPQALRARRAAGDLAGEGWSDVVLVIDNWPALRQDLEELEAPVQEIAARGLGYGVHLVMTANRWIDVRSSVRESIGGRLELRLHDPTESAINRRAAENVAKGVPGRGITVDSLHFQTALPRMDGSTEVLDQQRGLDELVAVVAAAWKGPRARPVLVLPQVVTVDDLPKPKDHATPGVPIGLSERDLAPVYLDLAADPHFLIFGDGESGKTNTLRTFLMGLMARRSPKQVQVLLVDYRRGLLGTVPPEYLVGYAGAEPAAVAQLTETAQVLTGRLPPSDLSIERLRARNWWHGPEVYVVADDYDLVVTSSGNPLLPLVPLLAQAKDVGLHLLIARRVGGAGRAILEQVLLRVRELGTPGLLLSGNPLEGALLGAYKAAPQPPGRGLLVKHHERPALIQVAFSGPSDPDEKIAPATVKPKG